MLGNFIYSNPTTLYFGKDALQYLEQALKPYGDHILLTYGGGSIKKNGIYDQVMAVLKKAGKTVVELGGVMPNPTVEKLMEGCRIVQENQIDFILAVGGGSTIDYSKAVSVSAYCKEDPWKKYFLEMKEPDDPIIPVGSVLTMVGTGSEMNGGAVITNPAENLKIGHVFGPEVMPKFAIMNPEFTFSVPMYQMSAGFFDIMSHIMEQYFSDQDDCTSDYIAEGLMRSLIHSTRIAIKDPKNYEARSNIMWTATWALNTLIAEGKSTDWEVHMLGQAISALTNATHGMTLAAVSLPYYRLILPYAPQKFKNFAINVWHVDPKGKSDLEIGQEGLERLKEWMEDIHVVMHSSELGVTAQMIPDLVSSTLVMTGGYHVLDQAEMAEIFKQSL